MNKEKEPAPQNPEAHQRNIGDADEFKALRILQQSLDEAQRGEGRDAREALRDIAAKYGVELRN